VTTTEVCLPIHHTGIADKVGEGEAVRMWVAWFDPPGRRVMTLGGSAVLWDLDAGAEVARLAGAMATFLPGGGLIGVRGHRQIFRREALDAPDEHLLFTLHPNTPKTIARDVIGLTADGRWAAVADPGADRFVLIDPAGGRAPVLLDQPDAYDAAFSPDGRLVATSSCWSDKPPPPVRVWEVPTGRLVREMPVGSAALVAFSPDGRWLVVSSTTEYQFWRVGSWEPGLRVPRRSNVPGHGVHPGRTGDGRRARRPGAAPDRPGHRRRAGHPDAAEAVAGERDAVLPGRVATGRLDRGRSRLLLGPATPPPRAAGDEPRLGGPAPLTAGVAAAAAA
jgi:hypothetical protein